MTQDERIRALEREHASAPRAETLHAVREAKFRAGLDPFPRALFTPEWIAVFSRQNPVHRDECGHGLRTYPTNSSAGAIREWPHACVHSDPASKANLDQLGLEDIERVTWIERHESPCRLEGREVLEVRLTATMGLRCSGLLNVEAGFLHGLASLAHVNGLAYALFRHSPCPAPMPHAIPTRIPYLVLSQMERQGLLKLQDTGVRRADGMPVEIRPLEEFQVEIGYPGQPLWRRTVLDGVLTRSYCARCGHEGSRHDDDGQCRWTPASSHDPESCRCERFLPPAVCRCGHARGDHDGGEGGCSGPASDEAFLCRDADECHRFDDGRPDTCSPYCSERHRPLRSLDAHMTEVEQQAHDRFFAQDP